MMRDAKERVQKVYPNAYAIRARIGWYIKCAEGSLSVYGWPSEVEAWEDAASKLPTPTAVPAQAQIKPAQEAEEVDDFVHEDDCPCADEQHSKDCKNCECESNICQIPPKGWRCTRRNGHKGPCAAVEAPEPIQPSVESSLYERAAFDEIERLRDELAAALARAEKAEAETLSLADSFGLPHDDDPFAAKLVVSGTFDLSPNGIKQRQRVHKGTIGDWIRRAKESESSRNKWHMICSDMGWPAETTTAAAFIDAIRFSQQENAELKAELTTLRQQLKDSEQERPIETQIATMKEIERLSFNRGIEAAAERLHLEIPQISLAIRALKERFVPTSKEPKQ
jgi:hypothetical protein